MFYAQCLLAKKGPLAKIWLAAHWEKKLTKAEVFDTDINRAVNEIMKPKVKMALRTVGHLLLGIVRIYSRKTRYLLADTNEAFIKMRLNFRSGLQVEINPMELEKDIEEDLQELGEMDVPIPEYIDLDINEELLENNLGRFEDITLKEDLNLNDPFESLNSNPYLNEDLMDLADMYGSIHSESPAPSQLIIEEVRRENESINVLEHGQPDSMVIEPDKTQEVARFDNTLQEGAPSQDDGLFNSMLAPLVDLPVDDAMDFEEPMPAEEILDKTDRGSFELEPLNCSHVDSKKAKRAKRARKLIIDEAVILADDDLRGHCEDFSDLIASINVAPPNKKTKLLCETGVLNLLMETPGMRICNANLLNRYRELLVPCKYTPDDTILQEEASSSSSSGPLSQPWDELELNENIDAPSMEFAVPANPEDNVYDAFDDFNHPAMNENVTLDFRADDEPGQAIGFDMDGNKENIEEEYSDPFSMSSTSSQARLEDYGFGKKSDDDSKWAKRAKHILKKISTQMENGGEAEVPFSQITSNAKNRKQAAEHFYSVLTLITKQAIQVRQDEPFGEILIGKGNMFGEEIERNPLRNL